MSSNKVGFWADCDSGEENVGYAGDRQEARGGASVGRARKGSPPGISCAAPQAAASATQMQELLERRMLTLEFEAQLAEAPPVRTREPLELSSEAECWPGALQHSGERSSWVAGGGSLPCQDGRPCKGKRDRFRKWYDALAQRVAEDPSGIDLQQLSRPFFFSDGRKWQKVMARLERLRDDAATKVVI